VQLTDYAGTWATNNVTVGRNGSNINGSAANSTLNINRESIAFVYVDATQGWVAYSGINVSPPPTQTIYKTSSGTYTVPNGVKSLFIRMVGGGGGGLAGNLGGGPTNGTNTTFGSSFLTAGFGSGGTTVNYSVPGAGGTASIGSGATGLTITGGNGTAGIYGAYVSGTSGGSSPFGGAGVGGYASGAAQAGTAASANSGSGGGGGNYASSIASPGGAGGGAGGYLEAFISAPASSYSYVIGAGGTGGTGTGTAGAGANGGSGVIIITEYY